MSDALKARIEAEGRRWHDLKIWPAYFEPVQSGRKPFEVRKNDRGFATGDVLNLREWDPATNDYTGRRIVRVVGYMLTGPQFGIEAGHSVMALETI
jgi:hypothetical protein